MHRIPADRQINAFALLHQSPSQRHIHFLDFAVVELTRQFVVRHVVLGDDHYA